MTEKENHLPNLSSEERAHALELAMQARRRYAALKARVKSGELTFTDAMDEEDAKRILVTSLLQSVPGIGASKAVVIMRLYRIPKGRRVGGLGIRQREALIALEKNERTAGNSAHSNSAIRDVSELGALARLKGNLSRLRKAIACRCEYEDR